MPRLKSLRDKTFRYEVEDELVSFTNGLAVHLKPKRCTVECVRVVYAQILPVH